MAHVLTPEGGLVYFWVSDERDKSLMSQVFSSVTVIFQNNLKTKNLHPIPNERVQSSKLEVLASGTVEVGTKTVPRPYQVPELTEGEVTTLEEFQQNKKN